MVAAYDGQKWTLAEDPMPGAHDMLRKDRKVVHGGSCWPSFGDDMTAKYHVPIGIAVTGHGGTSVKQWQPDEDNKKAGELFRWMMARIDALGPHGFRAALAPG